MAQMRSELYKLKDALLTTKNELEFCKRTIDLEVNKKLYEKLERMYNEIEENCKEKIKIIYEQRFKEGYEKGKLVADSEFYKNIIYRIIPEESYYESIFPFGRDTYKVSFYYQLFWKGSFPITNKIPLVEYEYKILKSKDEMELLLELYESSLKKAINIIREIAPIEADLEKLNFFKGKPIDLPLKILR